jgi:hypothetical protein
MGSVVVAVVAMAVVTAAQGSALSALVEPYLHVQDALASDRLEGVPAQAQAIEKAATSLGSDAAPMAAAARKLASAGDLAAAREAFGELSAALVAFADKTKSGYGTDVRLAYCPMKKLPWLTRDKTIRNPYYGSAMLTCGTFK